MSCAKPSTPKHAKRAWQRVFVGLCRLSLVAAAFFTLVPRDADVPEADAAILLAGARAEMAEVVRLGGERDGFHELLDAEGNSRGWVTSTFPHAANIRGYNGPSELMVVLDTAGQVRAARMIRSSDTAGHVDKVLGDSGFWEQWTGRMEAELGDPGTPHIVSGATLTSEAMARGVAARFGAEGMDQWFTKPIEPATVSHWFPSANRIEAGSRPGVSRVFAGETELGLVLRSSRVGVGARGFNGVSDVLVALDGDAVKGVGLLGSRDNQPYVGDVMDELRYADGFAGRKIEDILGGHELDGLVVSGASVTASAVTYTVREMLRRQVAEAPQRSIPWVYLAAAIWIVAGLVLGLGKRWSGKRSRIGFAIVSVAAGLAFGWMLGQDQLIGWARNGVDFSQGMPLLILTAVALLVPAFTGKNIYCSRICPHGAAQTLAGLAVKRRFALPLRVHRVLQRVPWLTLLAIWGLALVGSGFPLAMLEPFEVWSAGFYAILPAAILTIGLIAAVFLPQGYCHYGCPTGAMLKFLTHSPGNFTRRDIIAMALIAVAWTCRFFL
jgi:NosR/NirI family transcriptional regulator, nitrous oxide reductase regulator